METRVPRFSSVLGILLLFACFSPQTEAAFDPESFQVKLVALQKVLNYINDRPEQMNVDAIFGVTLAEANLVAALLHENVIYLKNEFFFALKEITVLSDQIRRKLINTIIDTTKNETILVLSNLYNPNLWVKPILWTRILSRSRPKPSQSLNYLEVVKFMYHGTPDEMESDQCLIEIVRSSLKAKCEIPASCTAILMEEDDSSGYPLTHRLLLVQVAKAMGCKETNASSLSSLVSAYCARIYQDLVKLEAWNFPRIARDLMMEQVVLCGMEGYHEFVDKHYEDKILSWSHSSGCFGLLGFSDEHKIARRSSSTIDFGCENHTTSVAAASFAIFIRENIENALNQN